MKLNDLVSRATDFCLDSHVTFKPYLPLCSEFRCVTLPSHLGGKVKAQKGENIYATARLERGKFYHHVSSLERGDITAKLLLSVKDGHEGASTDYTGAIILTFFRADPEAFDNLFPTKKTRLTTTRLLARLLDVPERKASAFDKVSLELFLPGEGAINDPRYHENKLRTIMGIN